MKLSKNIVIVLLTSIVLLLILSLVMYSLSQGSIETITEQIIDEPKEEDLDNQDTVSYYDMNTKISYQYPKTWQFVDNREGQGLSPKALCVTTCDKEILTIGSRKIDSPGAEPSEIAIYQFGLGYSASNSDSINGYETFYALYQRDSYTDHTYTVVGDNAYVQFIFREKDNTAGSEMNNQQYLTDFRSIVNSIAFN